MAPLPEDLSDQPSEVYTAPGFKRKKLWIIGGIIVGIVVLALFFFLNYTNLKSASRKLGTTSPNPEAKLSLKCPVPANLCQSAKTSSYNGQPALIYNLPKGTIITNAGQVIDSKQFVIQPYKPENPIGLYQSSLINGNCYTLAYTLPSDSYISKINLLPLDIGTSIATAGANLIDINGEKTNLIVKVQKRSVNPLTSNQPDYKKCAVSSLNPADFGEYQTIEPSTFNSR